MGPYRTTAEAIELLPGTDGAQRLPYTLLGPEQLRLTLTDGTSLVFTRSREAGGNQNAHAPVPGSIASVRVAEAGAAPDRNVWTNTSSQPWTNVPGRAPASPATEVSPPAAAGNALPGLVPTPDWLAKALANPPKFVPATNPPPALPATNVAPAGGARATSLHVGGLSEQDVAMANAVIAENTLTLSLPGLGTTQDGPGPLTEADRLVLLALKFYHQRQALVPFGELRSRLEQVELRENYRRAAEGFWAWFRNAAQQGKAAEFGGYKSEFNTYIAMKNTAKRRAANRVLAGQAASEAAWRGAMKSDQEFRQRVAERGADADRARADWLRQWQVQAGEAAAAEQEWQLYLGQGTGRSGNE